MPVRMAHGAILSAGGGPGREAGGGAGSCGPGDVHVRPGCCDARVLEIAETFLYGLVAAASLTTVLATLAVLASGRGRVNGLVFAIAFVLGQTVSVIVALLLGHAASSTGPDRHVGPAILIALGVLVMAFALRLRNRSVNSTPGAGRTQAVLARLERVRSATVFGIGVSLGIGAKRFAITLVAAASIASDDLGPFEEAALGALYIVVATIVVTVPVAGYLIVGARADEIVARSRAWLTTHERELHHRLAAGGRCAPVPRRTGTDPAVTAAPAILAILATLCFALAATLWQRATMGGGVSAGDPRSFLRLLREPVWLLGLVAQGSASRSRPPRSTAAAWRSSSRSWWSRSSGRCRSATC